MKRAFDRARDDRTLGVVDRGMVDDAMVKERPVLHQPKHGVSPFLLMEPQPQSRRPTARRPPRRGCIRNTAVRSAGRAPPGYRHVAAVQLENLQQAAEGSAGTPERKARDVMLRRRRCRPITSEAGLGRTGAAAVVCRDQPAMPIGRYKVAILADTATVKLLAALILFALLCALVPCDFAAAAVVPLPRPRPAEISTVPSAPEATPEEAPAPSACRLRLTAELAIAPSLPALVGPGECVVDDVVRLRGGRAPAKAP